MRSLALVSVFALALSVSAVPSTTLDAGFDNLEPIQSIEAKYPSDTFEKRHLDRNSVYAGYTCKKTFFSKDHIQATVKRACKKINSKSIFRRKFPKVYKPGRKNVQFRKVHGPQYSYPILKKGFYRGRKPRRYRVVVNSNCQLAGIVRIKKHRFHKCHKVFTTDGY